MKNKKGFTLVELLAVIVILALIMSIAVISIGGVINSTRQSTFKETAAGIIDGVQKHLIVSNELEAGYYVFTDTIVEKGGEKTPYGDDILYKGDGTAQGTEYKQIGQSPVYKVTSGTPSCAATKDSYVRVDYNASTYKYTYYICLTAGSGNYFIKDAEYTTLLGNETSMITNS